MLIAVVALSSNIQGFVSVQYVFMKVVATQKQTVPLQTKKISNYRDQLNEIYG